MKNQDLNSWDICNPDNEQDMLPMPYRLIDQVLNQTILYQLNLGLHHIQEKKKNSNYEGEVKQYITQTIMDSEGISCFSSRTKSHNHLLAGDKSGNVYLLDPAKKAIFSKKEVCPNRRVIKIDEVLITDGDSMITTAAIICNNHPNIFIIRYKHSQPKLFLTHQIILTQQTENINKYPYDCQFEDSGRLLIVKTYSGSIVIYEIPEFQLQLDQSIKNTPVPLPQQQIKKILKYPLKMAKIENDNIKIKDNKVELVFKGKQIAPSYNSLLQKLKKKKKQVPTQTDTNKKDSKKKDDKKPVENVVEEQQQKKLEFNQSIAIKQIQIGPGGFDNTQAYPLPKFKPFVYFLNDSFQLPKTKNFEKGTIFKSSAKIIYGWTNTQQFFIGDIRTINLATLPNYLYISYFQQPIPQQLQKKRTALQKQRIGVKNIKAYSNIYQISSIELSNLNQLFLACGLKDGTVAIWNIKTGNLEYTTDKHEDQVTVLKLFENWKVISGSAKGSIHIDNITLQKNEVKRTNVFQSKNNLPITNLEVSQLGIAFVLDVEGNLRAYDLWRNQKISRIHPCNLFALVQGKGKRWLSSQKVLPAQTLYTNRDFTIVLSTNWPYIPPRIQDATQQQLQKLRKYKQNPWKCEGTNIHIIRNFDFLLNLFEGLQNTYKKGYERKKIQNLFSNLQFSQLYDRTFDIPDFGKTIGIDKKMKKKDSGFARSSYSSRSSEKGRFTKSKSKISIKQDTSTAKLTNQILHPQKFLLQRRRIQRKQVVTQEVLSQLLRVQHQKKQRRQLLLNNDMSKLGF